MHEGQDQCTSNNSDGPISPPPEKNSTIYQDNLWNLNRDQEKGFITHDIWNSSRLLKNIWNIQLAIQLKKVKNTHKIYRDNCMI